MTYHSVSDVTSTSDEWVADYIAPANRLVAKHFGFVNVRCPVSNPINSAPLDFVRPRSVAKEEGIIINLMYPDRPGSIMGLAANDDHECIYQSNMTPDEVAIFSIYDNRGKPSIAHSVVDMNKDAGVKIARKSIVSRKLVRY